jgi:hypothetical protein
MTLDPAGRYVPGTLKMQIVLLVVLQAAAMYEPVGQTEHGLQLSALTVLE